MRRTGWPWDGTYSYTYDSDGNQITQTVGTAGATVRYTGTRGTAWFKLPITTASPMPAQQNATQTVKYTYDAFDRRIRETVTVGTTTTCDYLVYQDGSGQPYLEVSSTSGLASGYGAVIADRYLNVSTAGVNLLLADDQTGVNNNRVGQTLNTSFGPVWILADQDGTARDLVYYSTSTGLWMVTHRVFNAFGALEVTASYTGSGNPNVGTSVAVRWGDVGREHRVAELLASAGTPRTTGDSFPRTRRACGRRHEHLRLLHQPADDACRSVRGR